MALLSLALWIAGAALIVVAVMQARGPFAHLSELNRLAENARRYDSWRGGRRTAEGEASTTGADIMRHLLRRKLMVWAAVAAIGVALVVAGFIIR